MKYTILINQKQVCDAGLAGATDLVDWAIIDYVTKFYASPKAKRLDDHVWINLKTMIREMPLLGLKSKQALSRRITKHKDLNLLSCIYDKFGRMYAKPTNFCYACVESDGLGVNPELTGCQSEVDGGVNPELTGCQSEVDINQTSNTQPVDNKPVEIKATGNLTVIPPVEVGKVKKQIPYSAIVKMYHEQLPELPAVAKLTETRKRYIKNLYLDDLPTKKDWGDFFEYVKQSDFLMGRSQQFGDRKPFIANLEWITKPANFVKILESNYHE